MMTWFGFVDPFVKNYNIYVCVCIASPFRVVFGGYLICATKVAAGLCSMAYVIFGKYLYYFSNMSLLFFVV